MVKSIPQHPCTERPSCLLVGNGINKQFNDKSWAELIEQALKTSNQHFPYSELEQMPATMQIVAATKDHVHEYMNKLSTNLMNINMTNERASFLQSLLMLPVNDILTTNYTFELEIASGMEQRKTAYSSGLNSTFVLREKDKKFRLFQYYETKKSKRIWHIHGDISKPETMLMGHYYYGKQLKAIQECIAKTIRRYKTCQNTHSSFTPYSWIDLFLTGDIYILGLGMYLCESDLWYLLCCKKRNFPNTKAYYYDLSINDAGIRRMLEAYNVKIIDGIMLKASSYKTDFYPAVFKDIAKRIEKNYVADE